MDKVSATIPIKLSYSGAAKASFKKSSTLSPSPLLNTSRSTQTTNNHHKLKVIGSTNTQSQDIKDSKGVATLHEQNIITKFAVDQRVQFITKDKVTYQGICVNSVVVGQDNSETLTLRSAKFLKDGSKSPLVLPGTVSIKASDIVTVLSPQQLHVMKKSEQSGATPVDKTYYSSKSTERELNCWSASETQYSTTSSLLTLEESTSHDSWDQFFVNEKLFGCKTDFDEEIYTTSLDRSTPEFKKLEKDAERIAREIQYSYSSNPHVSEEREQDVVDHGGSNEEEKYSSVIRNPNSYVPPAFRKNSSLLVEPQQTSNTTTRESDDLEPDSNKEITTTDASTEEKEKPLFKFNTNAQEFIPKPQSQHNTQGQQSIQTHQIPQMYPNSVPHMMYPGGTVYYYPSMMTSYYPSYYPPQS